MTPQEAAPGWYEDPWGTAPYRYWDGMAWTQGTYDGVASTSLAPADESRPRGRRGWMITGASVVVAGALAIGGIVVVNSAGGDPEGTVIAAGYAWAPTMELAPDKPLELPMKTDPRALPDGDEDGVFAIYIDSALTKPIFHSVHWFDGDDTADILPMEDSELDVSSDAQDLDDVDSVHFFDTVPTVLRNNSESEEGYWLSYEEYYVVQYYDAGGELRETPLVHTVRSSEAEQLLDAITPSFATVGTDGRVQVTWDAPEGAPADTEYAIIKSSTSEDLGLVPWVVVSTGETSWTSRPSTDYDGDATLKLYQGKSVADMESGEFTYELAEELSQIAVVAIADGQHSRIRYVDADSAIGMVPYEDAAFAVTDRFGRGDQGDLTNTATQFPLTTLNGNTMEAPITLDVGSIVPHVATLDELLTGEVGEVYGRVDGTVSGTSQTLRLNMVKPDNVALAEWPAVMTSAVKAFNERSVAERPKIGAMATYNDLSGVIVDGVIPSTVAPKSDYALFGSNELTLYIAANLMAGEQAIDVSAYDDQASLPSAHEAYREAYVQNPLINAVVEQSAIRDDIIYVTYHEDTQPVEQTQAELNALAEGIVADVVDDSMADVEKVTAINTWMVENIDYDYDVFETAEREDILFVPKDDEWRAWDTRGALLDGLVVCGGYADTFNLLAREAGLESVYVSGNTAGGAHAWNHVLIDGRWKAIDTTWNDNDTDTTLYLLIDEDEFTGSAARTINESGWMPGMFQGDYATD